MRAYQLDQLGSLDGLVLAERDIPSPGVGEVLVRVRASSLNFRDIIILNGLYPAWSRSAQASPASRPEIG